MPALSKKIFRKKLSKIVVDGPGRSDYEKFLLDSIFPTKLTEFPTKLTEFVPFIFIISQYCPTVKKILPDWLCLPNKLGGGGYNLTGILYSLGNKVTEHYVVYCIFTFLYSTNLGAGATPGGMYYSSLWNIGT